MDFYRINEKYNQFLQKYKKEHRGVTKVPNIRDMQTEIIFFSEQ